MNVVVMDDALRAAEQRVIDAADRHHYLLFDVQPSPGVGAAMMEAGKELNAAVRALRAIKREAA